MMISVCLTQPVGQREEHIEVADMRHGRLNMVSGRSGPS